MGPGSRTLRDPVGTLCEGERESGRAERRGAVRWHTGRFPAIAVQFRLHSNPRTSPIKPRAGLGETGSRRRIPEPEKKDGPPSPVKCQPRPREASSPGGSCVLPAPGPRLPDVKLSATPPYPELGAVPRRRRPLCYSYTASGTTARRQANQESEIPEDDQEEPEYLPEEEANEQDSGDDEPDNLVARDDWYED
ncbi:hypothetical protein U9M48_032401 [Paspalum notatum var. saurae]|uniref:Uncharacterized protein n=1 Tax=Paspalum notatum var. saurae TaxID=547442 RepID=A0AAQ3U5H2_PASNO